MTEARTAMEMRSRRPVVNLKRCLSGDCIRRNFAAKTLLDRHDRQEERQDRQEASENPQEACEGAFPPLSEGSGFFGSSRSSVVLGRESPSAGGRQFSASERRSSPTLENLFCMLWSRFQGWQIGETYQS